jgi:hypothetical protein
MPKDKAKRKLNLCSESGPSGSKKRSQDEGGDANLFEDGNQTRVKVDDLHDGLFFKSRSEMNAEQRQRLNEYLDQQEQEEERKRDEQWNAEKQFEKRIITLGSANRKPDGSSMKGFTVWCSDWSTSPYNTDEPRTKYFDSTWSSQADANERARYLFYWKNYWGADPEEIERDEEAGSRKNIGGLIQYCYSADGGSSWRVGVVPDSAYPYLDESSMGRYHSDE